MRHPGAPSSGRFLVSHRITFIVYLPNSMDMSMAALDDSVESDIQIMEFSEFAKQAALDYLVRIFREDLARRQNANWVKPVQIIPLVDGQHLDNVPIDTAVDVNALVSHARLIAQGA